MCLNVYIGYLIVEYHHIDNEEEAAEFINNHVNFATAFLMPMDATDKEQDCQAMQGSSEVHEIR